MYIVVYVLIPSFLFVVQVQTKYLGRNWRKNNMKTISAIYRRVRHHLHDDWAYGNDLDAKPWDFQQQVESEREVRKEGRGGGRKKGEEGR